MGGNILSSRALGVIILFKKIKSKFSVNKEGIIMEKLLKGVNIAVVVCMFMEAFFTNAFAEDGVTVDKILLGQSCAMSGPAKDLGTKMQAGLLAYLGKANNEGGINGRKISLISKDDGYEPDCAIANTRDLIEKDKVFLLIGEVGTPTSKVGKLNHCDNQTEQSHQLTALLRRTMIIGGASKLMEA
jgi:hypothetical protein